MVATRGIQADLARAAQIWQLALVILVVNFVPNPPVLVEFVVIVVVETFEQVVNDRAVTAEAALNSLIPLHVSVIEVTFVGTLVLDLSIVTVATCSPLELDLKVFAILGGVIAFPSVDVALTRV